MGISEFLYYAILKHGKLIIIILGIIVGILVFTFFSKWSTRFDTTTDVAASFCEEDIECQYDCGRCVSIPPSELCEPCEECKCVCLNNSCQLDMVITN